MKNLITGLFILFSSLFILYYVGIGSLFLMYEVKRRAIEREGQEQNAKADIANLKNMLSQYKTMVGAYPPTLTALTFQPTNMADPSMWVEIWQDRYRVNPALKLDPWKRPYEYIVKGSEYEIRSLGPDGHRGTGDDIVGTKP